MLILDGITLPVDCREEDALERAAGRLKLSAGDIRTSGSAGSAWTPERDACASCTAFR